MSVLVETGAEQGFSDTISFEFADAEGGLFGLAQIELLGTAGKATAVGVLFDHSETAASLTEVEVAHETPPDWGDVNVGGVAIRNDDQSARFGLASEAASFELEFHGAVAADFGRGTWVGTVAHASQHVAAGRVSGEVRRDGTATPIDCLGRAMRTVGAVDWQRLGVVRSLGAAFEDGGMLAAWAARPASAEGHGSEAISAVIAEPDGALTVAHETLLSTQYDDAGRHRHANLEIYATAEEGEEEGDGDGDGDIQVRPLRAAGAIICGTSIDLGARRLNTAFLRWSMDGRPGLGRYDVVRPA